jgi:hypothetical protein
MPEKLPVVKTLYATNNSICEHGLEGKFENEHITVAPAEPLRN